MTPEVLDELTYLPTIRSRHAELRGYSELTPETKATLRPVVSLGRLGQIVDAGRVAERITNATGGEFFLDLNTFQDQQCETWQELCSPDGNFRAWRDFAANIQNATPVALIRDGAAERAFIRQVLAIEEDHGVVAIRSRRPASELPMLQAAIAAVDDVSNLMVILDVGYIRASMDAKEVEANRAINVLRTVDPSIRIALVSSSFPRAVSAYGEEGNRLEILERDLHSQIGGSDVVLYGDHAAIYPDPFAASPARWVPRIDYATDDAWIFRRHRADDRGFVRCAEEIVALPDWDADFAETNWGAAKILEQAEEEETLAGFGSPAPWISVRVNMHIERQASLGGSGGDYEEEE